MCIRCEAYLEVMLQEQKELSFKMSEICENTAGLKEEKVEEDRD